MSNADDFMKEVRDVVAQRRNTLTQKAKTMAWYSGREALRHLPLTGLKSLGLLIPVPGVGAAVNLAIEAALAKVTMERAAAKRLYYQGMAVDEIDPERLRKAAKFDTKDHTQLSALADSNLVKLKDATTAVKTAIIAFEKSISDSESKSPSKEAVWNLAYALYDVKHYEDKIFVYVELMKERTKSLKTYLDASRKATSQYEANLIGLIDALEKSGKDLTSQTHVRSPLGQVMNQGFQQLR